jgi:ribosome-binding protein aMBF1 (putative translation factor)
MATALKAAKRQGRLSGSHSEPAVPAEPKKRPDPKTYSGRVALRLRALRESRGWSGKELKRRLKEAGKAIPLSTVYAYEAGSAAGGVDIPLALLPFYADVFGLKTPNGVLPAE